MALVTTAGAADADAFADVAAVTAFATAYGLTGWTTAARSPAADDEAAIRRATTWLSTAFGWKGARTDGRTQALAWPRTDVEDAEGETVASTAIPTEIVKACCYVAAAERANPGVMSPTVDLTARVKRERVGPLEVEYAAIPNAAELARPVLLVVNDLVSGLVAAGTNSLVGTAVRG